MIKTLIISEKERAGPKYMNKLMLKHFSEGVESIYSPISLKCVSKKFPVVFIHFNPKYCFVSLRISENTSLFGFAWLLRVSLYKEQPNHADL